MQPASGAGASDSKLLAQNQELKTMMKMTIFKLGVLENNLNLTKGSLGDGKNDNLETSIAQVNALLESLRSGLESNQN